jgi:pilus assembly protein FimV
MNNVTLAAFGKLLTRGCRQHEHTLQTTRHPFQSRFFAVGVLVALLLPVAARAVSIGDIALQSRLGEPLRARVDLTLDQGERVDSACLSLSPPDAREEDPGSYLTRADLVYKTDGTQQYVLISTQEPFNDAFAKLRLQIKCPGVGSIAKTLIALPDPDINTIQPPIAAPSAPPEAAPASAVPSAALDETPPAKTPETVSAPAKSVTAETKPAEVKKAGTKKAAQATGKSHAKRVAKKQKPSPHTSSLTQRDKKSGLKAVIKIQPFGAPVSGKSIADDQMASLLDMQHQVKELQAELAAMKLKLAQSGLDSAPSAAQPSPTPASSVATPVVAAASAPQNIQKPAVKPPAAANELPGELFAALGLALALLALWLGLRYYTRSKSVAPLTDEAPLEVAPAIKLAPVRGNEKPQLAAETGVIMAKDRLPQAAVKSEEDQALEEAALYAAHKREARAIEIVREIIKYNPAKTEAWSLLFSIYSAQGKKGEFEQAAREFLSHHKNHPLWSKILGWGQTLDQGNPLYRQ